MEFVAYAGGDGPSGKALEARVEKGRGLLRQLFQSYPVEEISVSFNGGKDSCVVMDLLLEELGAERFTQLRFVNFVEGSEFPELLAFVRQFAALRSISVHEIRCGSIKEGLESLVNTHRSKVCILGTRIVDPAGKFQKEEITQSTPGWPAVTLVAPILYWNYDEVWDYLKSRRTPICSLYGKGYTSIGCVHTTVPNPALLVQQEGAVSPTFRPAWELGNHALERAGRRPKAVL